MSEDEKPTRKPTKNAKGSKAARRRDEEDEDEDDRPTKYKRKDAGKSKTPLIVGRSRVCCFSSAGSWG